MKIVFSKRVLPVLLLIVTLVFSHSAAAAQSDGDKALLSSGPMLSKEEQKSQLRQLEAAAEKLYTDMQQGNTQQSLTDMEQLIAALEGVSFKGLTSVEGIHALAESIMDARQTLAKVEIVPEEWAKVSARLRLAVNSLLHHDKALWLQYYKVMADDLQQMNKARAGGNPAELRAAFKALQEHYELIRPAAVIRRDPSIINQFESWLSYAQRLSNDRTLDEATLKNAIPQGERTLRVLFGRKGEEPVFLPITGYNNPWYWSGLIGAWIVLALCYTGIRKYQATQVVMAVRKKDDETARFRL